MRDPADRIHDGELAALPVRLLRNHLCDRPLGGRPGLEQIEQPGAPSAGLVMFCEATAPTTDRRCRQREATARLDELSTIPNAPVAGSRAASENVMSPLR